MPIPEDTFDLWGEFAWQLKFDPLNDLFNSVPKPAPTQTTITEAPLTIEDYASDDECMVIDSFENNPTPTQRKITEAPLTIEDYASDDECMVIDSFENKPTPTQKKITEAPVTTEDHASEAEGVVTDSFEKVQPLTKARVEPQRKAQAKPLNKAILGGVLKASKLYANEDFHSYFARESDWNEEQLSALGDDVSVRPGEDFVSFLARYNGIEDEQMVNSLREALTVEPAIEFKSDKLKPDVAVKMEVDLDLKVRDGEDAATFFARARLGESRSGLWESSSLISEQLASMDLDDFWDEDEDAESFFRRTEGIENTDVHSFTVSQPVASEALTPLGESASVQRSGPISESMKSILEDRTVVVVKKRKTSAE